MSSTADGESLGNSIDVTDITATPEPPRKRRRSDTPEREFSDATHQQNYSPANTKVVKVLRNDSRSKTICLHVKFADCIDTDGIIVLQKSPFPSDIDGVCKAQLGVALTGNAEKAEKPNFSVWEANKIVDNDIYHRYDVIAGLELVNNVSMTVIHPAEEHHFAKYTASRRRIIMETPDIYAKAIVPFLTSHPKDLSWVDNILYGTAEVERVLYTVEDALFGFKFLLDYRWNGHQLNELHALGLARDSSLMCLRDLRAQHVPMLKKMLAIGRRELVSKYGGLEEKKLLREDQIIAYFHYPPTFYRLHMHFVHVDGAADGGTQAGKAHIAEDVIANLEMKSEYYAERTLPMYLHDNHPFLVPIRKVQEEEETMEVQ